MPGGPAETMIGLGGLGIGILLVVSAVKNKNPLALIRQAVTTGSLSFEGVPDLVEIIVGGKLVFPADVNAALNEVQAKDKGLRDDIVAELGRIESSPSRRMTQHFIDLINKVANMGLPGPAETLLNYGNTRATVKPSSTVPTDESGRFV